MSTRKWYRIVREDYAEVAATSEEDARQQALTLPRGHWYNSDNNCKDYQIIRIELSDCDEPIDDDEEDDQEPFYFGDHDDTMPGYTNPAEDN